jgi:two-component system, response regulator
VYTADVLLVEDNVYEAELTIRSLKKNNMGGRLLHLEDAQDALDYVFAKGKYEGQLNAAHLRLIILDLQLPKMNGLEILKQIKTNDLTKSIPVVILSSSRLENDINNGYESGVNSYVVKPVNFDEYSQTVAKLGNYWLQLNQQSMQKK